MLAVTRTLPTVVAYARTDGCGLGADFAPSAAAGDGRGPLTCYWPMGTTRPEATLGFGLIFTG